MDGPRDCHTEWSKSDKNIVWHPLYMNSKKKWYKWTYKTERDSQRMNLRLWGRDKLGSLGWTCTHSFPTRRSSDLTAMFIAALFIIARTWKQPKCPSAVEWIRKLWYIYTMEYYSAIKMNTFESVLMRWMKLEPIIQSEVSQKEKHQYSILTHI